MFKILKTRDKNFSTHGRNIFVSLNGTHCSIASVKTHVATFLMCKLEEMSHFVDTVCFSIYQACCWNTLYFSKIFSYCWTR